MGCLSPFAPVKLPATHGRHHLVEPYRQHAAHECKPCGVEGQISGAFWYPLHQSAEKGRHQKQREILSSANVVSRTLSPTPSASGECTIFSIWLWVKRRTHTLVPWFDFDPYPFWFLQALPFPRDDGLALSMPKLSHRLNFRTRSSRESDPKRLPQQVLPRKHAISWAEIRGLWEQADGILTLGTSVLLLCHFLGCREHVPFWPWCSMGVS